MKGMRNADILAIQKACIDIFQAMPANNLKLSFELWFSRANKCIEANGDYFELDKTVLPNNHRITICCSYFEKSLFTLRQTL